MGEQLKPCPFCGGKAEIINADECGPDAWTVHCTVCWCSSVVMTAVKDDVRGDLVAKWNTRFEPMAEQTRAAFNAAIAFTLSLEEAHDAIAFLQDWTEGDTSEWPEFQGHQKADRPSGPMAGSERGDSVADTASDTP